MKVRAIVTGVTGMVGEGVLHECLLDPEVESVLVITRKSSGTIHPKLTEIIHNNFFDLSPIEQALSGYNACFFCLGVTSIGKKENEYYHLTYDLTMHVARTLSKINHDMTFCYVSGTGTDTSEKGKTMWARVKGKTENDLMKLPFRKAYMFRPGYIQPTRGLKNTLRAYALISWLFPVWKLVFSKHICTLRELGLAMIHTVTVGYEKQLLESGDIVALASTKVISS
jgi:uncharacterized protein YbjT (DUF2867 family)